MTTKNINKLPKSLEMAVSVAEARGAPGARFVTELLPHSAPRILGGHITGTVEENGFLGQHYGQIQRPSPCKLPGIHSEDATFKNKDIEKAFKDIYGLGEVTYIITVERRYRGQDIFDFHILAMLDETDKFDKKFQGPVVEIWFSPDGHQERIVNPEFERSLTLGQKTALFRRTTHLFFRLCGNVVPQPLFQQICENLQDEYTNYEWWQEALDIAMTYADIVLSDDMHLGLKVKALEAVAQLLGANTEFESASLVYQDIITSFWDDSIAEPGFARSLLAGFYMYASINSERALKFKEAEEFLIKALNLEFVVDGKGSNFPWSADGWNKLSNKLSLVICMVNFYRVCAKAKWEGHDGRFHTTLVCLLLAGEVKADNPRRGVANVIEEAFGYIGSFPAGTTPRMLLKPKFQSKKAAQRVLTTALLDPSDVAKFRSTITSACTTSLAHVINPDKGKALTKEEMKDYTKHQKEAARKHNLYLFPSHGGGVFSVQCALPTCGLLLSVKDLLHCPCKMVGYCGKECQVADWKRHKKDCAWQAEKKKEKKAGKK